MSALLQFTWPGSSDNWVLSLRHFPQIGGGAFLASTGSGALALYSLTPSGKPIATKADAHESSVNGIEKIDENTVVLVSTDGMKLWDLRANWTALAQLHVSDDRKSNFLSAGSKDTVVATGTELAGQDAIVELWDIRAAGKRLRSFVDSHHDDVTAIQFHPSLPYLMSGSTDGCVNVYNLEEQDEEDALHQVVNFASVHLCKFTSPQRISVLSHMETVAFFELNSQDYENSVEPKPRELGDVRAVWPNCEYVVDIYPEMGYVAYGANSTASLTLMPFVAGLEEFVSSKSVVFPRAHGEEVVRDVMKIPGTTSVITCGEDGDIKAWKLPKDFESETGTPDDHKEGKKEKKKKDKKRRDKKDRYKPY